MIKHDIEAARKLLSISLDNLPAALQKATKAQIGLAQQAAIKHITATTLAAITDDEGYRYELITKEMSRRGFQTFAGCLASYTAEDLNKITNELSLQLKNSALETHISGARTIEEFKRIQLQLNSIEPDPDHGPAVIASYNSGITTITYKDGTTKRLP